MKKKRTFAYLGTHEIGKTTVAVEAIKCGLSNVSVSVCGFCKGENWIDEGILTKPCPSCGGKQTDR